MPLHKWLQAIHLMASSKKGISSHQLHRVLGITYKTAWFLAHRIREAMRVATWPRWAAMAARSRLTRPSSATSRASSRRRRSARLPPQDEGADPRGPRDRARPQHRRGRSQGSTLGPILRENIAKEATS